MSGVPGRHIRHLLARTKRGKKRHRRAPCCERMKFDLAQRCPMHRNRLDCADNLVFYSPELDEYGLIIHDGTGSLVEMHFCPWCGADLRPQRSRKR